MHYKNTFICKDNMRKNINIQIRNIQVIVVNMITKLNLINF